MGEHYIGVEISPGYRTPASQFPWGIILPRFHLPGVWYPSPGSPCKELSIRSSKSDTCFTYIIFLARNICTLDIVGHNSRYSLKVRGYESCTYFIPNLTVGVFLEAGRR